MITTKGDVIRVARDGWLHKRSISFAKIYSWKGRQKWSVLIDGPNSLGEFDTEEAAIQCLEEFAGWWAEGDRAVINKNLYEIVGWLKTKGLYEECLECLGIHKPHIINPQGPNTPVRINWPVGTIFMEEKIGG